MPARSRVVLLSDGVVDLDGRRIVRRGVACPLTDVEVRFLDALSETPGEYVSVGYLLETAWETRYRPERDDKEQLSRIRNAVSRLREKVETDAKHPIHLLNRPEVGYCLAAATFDRAPIGEVCAALLLGEPVVLQGGWQMGTSWAARRVLEWWAGAVGPAAAVIDLRRERDRTRLAHPEKLFAGLVPPETRPGLIVIDHVERARRYGGTAAVDDALFDLVHQILPVGAGWRVLLVDRPVFSDVSSSVSFRLPATRVNLTPLGAAALAQLVGSPASDGPEIAAWTGGSPGWALELARWRGADQTWSEAASRLIVSRSGLGARFAEMFTGELLRAAEQLMESGPVDLPRASLRALAWLGVVDDPPHQVAARLAKQIVERVVCARPPSPRTTRES